MGKIGKDIVKKQQTNYKNDVSKIGKFNHEITGWTKEGRRLYENGKYDFCVSVIFNNKC